MPGLVTNYQKQATVTKLKKAYNILTNAVLLAQSEHGDTNKWITVNAEDFKGQNQQVADILKPHLRIVKDCAFDGGCWKDGDIYRIDGVSYGQNYAEPNNWYTFILQDGMTMLLANNNVKGSIQVTVDVDGFAGANTFGKDVFLFGIADNKIMPLGYDDEEILLTYCSKTGEGSLCAAKIMRDGWKIKDDYPW